MNQYLNKKRIEAVIETARTNEGKWFSVCPKAKTNWQIMFDGEQRFFYLNKNGGKYAGTNDWGNKTIVDYFGYLICTDKKYED